MEIIVPYDAKFTGQGGGVICELGWTNPIVKSALEKAFALQKWEILLGLTITSQGIKAHFGRVKPPLPLPVPKRVKTALAKKNKPPIKKRIK